MAKSAADKAVELLIKLGIELTPEMEEKLDETRLEEMRTEIDKILEKNLKENKNPEIYTSMMLDLAKTLSTDFEQHTVERGRGNTRRMVAEVSFKITTPEGDLRISLRDDDIEDEDETED